MHYDHDNYITTDANHYTAANHYKSDIHYQVGYV